MGTETLTFAAIALVLLLVALSMRGQARSETARLFRALVPSWRFFQEIDPVPILSFRTAGAGAELGPWSEALAPLPRTILSLFANGESNLRLAEHGVVEALLAELHGRTHEEAQRLVAYRRVQAMIGRQLGTEIERYQFRLVASDGASADEEVFRSEVHRIP
jgi:hypothetical protein